VVITTIHREDYRSSDYKKGRFYHWKNETEFLSVTNGKSGLPMPQYRDKTLTYEYLQPNWADLGDLKAKMGDEDFFKFLRNRAASIDHAKMEFGSAVHKGIEVWQYTGQRPDVYHKAQSAETDRCLDQFADAVATLKPVVYAVEAIGYNRKFKFAGTLDAIWDLDLPERLVKGRCLIDFKTGASGIWPNDATQFAALCRLEFIAVGDEELPMPQIDHAFALWLRPTKWELIPVDISDDTFRVWRAAAFIKEWKNTREDETVGRAVAKGRAE
jgi:hypothetical protein